MLIELGMAPALLRYYLSWTCRHLRLLLVETEAWYSSDARENQNLLSDVCYYLLLLHTLNWSLFYIACGATIYLHDICLCTQRLLGSKSRWSKDLSFVTRKVWWSIQLHCFTKWGEWLSIVGHNKWIDNYPFDGLLKAESGRPGLMGNCSRPLWECLICVDKFCFSKIQDNQFVGRPLKRCCLWFVKIRDFPVKKMKKRVAGVGRYAVTLRRENQLVIQWTKQRYVAIAGELLLPWDQLFDLEAAKHPEGTKRTDSDSSREIRIDDSWATHDSGS